MLQLVTTYQPYNINLYTHGSSYINPSPGDINYREERHPVYKGWVSVSEWCNSTIMMFCPQNLMHFAVKGIHMNVHVPTEEVQQDNKVHTVALSLKVILHLVSQCE